MIYKVTDIFIDGATPDSIDILDKISIANNYDIIHINEVDEYGWFATKKILVEGGYYRVLGRSYELTAENCRKVASDEKLEINLRIQHLTIEELKQYLIEKEMYEDLDIIKK